MIPKSMSRKTPSFGQLVSYMSSEKADDVFDLYQNCLARGDADIAEAFLQNSQHLRVRKNGNYLYHEIISISLEQGVDRKHAKECLREIALKYIQDRCPRNMVYGCLHDDHTDHLHYHLMISANEQHQSARLRLSKSQFDRVKRDLETYVLETYPELKQRKIVTAERDDKKVSHKASKQKQRTGKLERQDGVRATIVEAMNFANSLDDFKAYLEVKRYRFYTRGKNYGVEVTHDTGKVAKYRFSTLGVHDDFESYLVTLSKLKDAESDHREPQEDDLQKGDAEKEASSDGQNLDSDNAGLKEKDQDRFEDPGAEEHATFQKPQQEHQTAQEPRREASTFQQDMESIYAKKREKRTIKKAKTLKRKPRSR